MSAFFVLLALAAFGLGRLAAVSGNHVLVDDLLHEPSASLRLVGMALAGATMANCALLAVAAPGRRFQLSMPLPAACETFLVVSTEGRSLAGYVHEGHSVQPIEPDRVSHDEAMAAARQLAPVVDSGVPVDDASDLPRTVSLLSLTGTELARSETAVLERWSESRSILTGPRAPALLPRRPGTLRAVVGQSSQGTFSVDIRTDGPHALVGGTQKAQKLLEQMKTTIDHEVQQQRTTSSQY